MSSLSSSWARGATINRRPALGRGESVGRYVVLGLVGKGGMGEVYAAYDPELDRKIALKILFVKPEAGMTVSEGHARLLREAQAIAKLLHPNVVVVFDVGEFERSVFMAMEFVDGHTLGWWLAAQDRPWKEVLKHFVAAGRGLAAAHEAGIIHRDFKPENVMLGHDGKVRVMDFGLARQLSAVSEGGEPRPSPVMVIPDVGLDDPDTRVIGTASQRPVFAEPAVADLESLTSPGTGHLTSEITQAGALLGTPAYMAPEQLRGRIADARSDQFSFCVALFEGLYGRRPFPGSSLHELTRAVVRGEVSLPPAGSKVPSWVLKVLKRGLRANSSERWETLGALLDALENDPSARRKRWLMTAAAGIVPVATSLLILGSRAPAIKCTNGEKLTGTFWGSSIAGQASRDSLRRAFIATGKSYAPQTFEAVAAGLDRFTSHWGTMYRDVCEASHVRRDQSDEVMDLRMTCLNERLSEAQSLTSLLSQATADVLKNAVPAVESLSQLSRCDDVAALKAVVKPPADPMARKQVEQLTHELAAARAAVDAGSKSELQRQLAVLEPRVESVHYAPLTASLLNFKSILLFWMGNSQAAVEVGESALWAAEASRDDRMSSDVLNRLAYTVRYGSADLAQGHRWLKLHQAVLDRMGGNPLRQAWLAMDQASYALADGDGPRGVELERHALELKLSVLPADDLDVAKSWGNLANALETVGGHEEALQANSKALDILMRKLGEHHPDVALNQNNRGEILLALGRATEAKDSFLASAKVFTEAFGSEHAFLAYPLYGLGLSWLKLGNVDYAMAPLEQALAIRRKAETEPERLAEAELALAQALWAKGPEQRARARALASEAETTLARFRKTSARLAEARLWLKAHRAS